MQPRDLLEDLDVTSTRGHHAPSRIVSRGDSGGSLQANDTLTERGDGARVASSRGDAGGRGDGVRTAGSARRGDGVRAAGSVERGDAASEGSGVERCIAVASMGSGSGVKSGTGLASSPSVSRAGQRERGMKAGGVAAWAIVCEMTRIISLLR